MITSELHFESISDSVVQYFILLFFSQEQSHETVKTYSSAGADTSISPEICYIAGCIYIKVKVLVVRLISSSLLFIQRYKASASLAQPVHS